VAKIIKTKIQALKQKKGENIISLERWRKIPEAVADYLIICGGWKSTEVYSDF
jgi:ribosomal silencing factor RsfS